MSTPDTQLMTATRRLTVPTLREIQYADHKNKGPLTHVSVVYRLVLVGSGFRNSNLEETVQVSSAVPRYLPSPHVSRRRRRAFTERPVSAGAAR